MKTAICFVILFTGCAPSPNTSHAVDAVAIDAEALRLMKRENVEGLALAVIEDGKVAHVAAYGRRNVERNLPLTIDTIMYGASLTKTAFAYMVLQLVDEGRLNLDRSVADLLPRPLPEYDDYKDLAGDERWRALTPRILLTHTSGFANFRWLEADQRLCFHYDPGSRYSYSGEGFYILQLILEEGLGLDVGKEMQTRVFDRFGMTHTSMTWRPDFATNLADGYGLDGRVEPHDERSGVSAAGSMDTSIGDQARLWAGIVRGDDLSRASRAELVRSQVPITSAHQFPTLTTETEPKNAEIGLAAGLGLVTFQDTSGPAWFKAGHNDWTGNMVICLEKQKRCVVMLANDIRAERIYPELARMILGDTKMPWTWEYHWLDARGAAPGTPGPELYGAGLFSTGEWDFFLAFSPDQRRVLFCRANDDFSAYQIYETRRDTSGGWSASTNPRFAGSWSNADPHIAPDGKTVFFISNRPGPGETGPQATFDIWCATLELDGEWGEAERLPSPICVSGVDEWSPSVAANGDLYFGSERPAGRGGLDLWVTRRVNDVYLAPENLGDSVNTAGGEVEPWIAPDQSYLIFSGRGRTDSVGRYDLYLSRREHGVWRRAQPVGAGVNTVGFDFNQSVSPDGQWLYFSSTRPHTGPLGDRFDTPRNDSLVTGIGNGKGDMYRIPLRELGLWPPVK